MGIPSEQEITQILNSSYSPSHLDQLEAYLDAQMEGTVKYHTEALRNLVKLYQLFPETFKQDKLESASLLALIHNVMDLWALQYMLPHAFANTESLTFVVKSCATMLEACQFDAFWKSYQDDLVNCSSNATIAKVAKSSIPTVQSAIIKLLALTYKEAPTSVVTKALQIPSEQDPVLQTHTSVESATSEKVVFVGSSENTKRQKVFQDGVDFSAITALIGKTA